jgi:hypothetical protein
MVYRAPLPSPKHPIGLIGVRAQNQSPQTLICPDTPRLYSDTLIDFIGSSIQGSFSSFWHIIILNLIKLPFSVEKIRYVEKIIE